MFSVLTIMLLCAHASAEPARVLITTSAAEEPERAKVEQWVMKRLKREVKFEASDAVDPKSLLFHPNECLPALTEAEQAMLEKISGQGELFVALTPSSSHKDLMLWRYDTGSKTLQKVLAKGGGKFEAPPQDVPARVVILPWPMTDQAAEVGERSLSRIARTDPKVLLFSGSQDAATDLIDQLMVHPNECTPELNDKAVEVLTAEAAKEEGELYVIVHVAGNQKMALLWRWDPSSGNLLKVLNPR